jgi:hypothetical protein
MNKQSAVVGKLEFNLPEAQDEFQLAIDGSKWFSVVSDLDEFLRSKVKYGGSEDKNTVCYQEIRDCFHEIISGYGVSLHG